MFAPIGHHTLVQRYIRVACGGIGLLGLLALSPCRPDASVDDRRPPPLTNPTDRDVQQGISLVLSVDQAELTVGDELRFRLAFRNDSNEPAFVVPPIDGSWDDLEEPAYDLEFADSDGKRVLYALGYIPNIRGCGNSWDYSPNDRRVVDAHGTFTLEDAHDWAPKFRVLEHARPGVVWLRVRYRADKLPGIAPIDIVSNPVKLTIHNSDKKLWSCTNALVEKAELYDSVENEPLKLIARGDGYLLVYRRNVRHVESRKITSSGTIFIQEIGSRGELLGNAIQVAQSESDTRWLGDIRALEVPNGLLSDVPTSRKQLANGNNATSVDSRFVLLSGDGHKLIFTSAPGTNGPRVLLSESFDWKYFLEATADGSKLLAAWMDFGIDKWQQCDRTHPCASEAYVAVLDPNGQMLVPPTRATKDARPRPTPIDEVNFREGCGIDL